MTLGPAFITRARALLAEDYLPKIEHCLELVDDKQIWWRANAQSNSICNLLLHLNGNVRQWIVSGVGAGTDARDRDAEFAARSGLSKEELLARLKETLREVDQTLGQLDPCALLESRRIQGFDVTVLDAVFHVVEHFSMHTGQIIMMAKVFSEVDLGFYDFSGAGPVKTWKKAAD